jgi:hypothetical protein
MFFHENSVLMQNVFFHESSFSMQFFNNESRFTMQMIFQYK